MPSARAQNMWVTGIACILIAVFSWMVRNFPEVSLVGLTAVQVASFLAILLLVAGVIERAVEVLVNGFVDPAKSERDGKVRKAQQQVERANEALTVELNRSAGAPPDSAVVTKRRNNLEQEEDALRDADEEACDPERRLVTAKWARVLTLVFSFAAATVGLRVLGQLLHTTGSPLGGELNNCDTLDQVAAVAKDATQRVRQVIETLPTLEGSDKPTAEFSEVVQNLNASAASLTESAGELAEAQSAACKNVYTQVSWLRMVDVVSLVSHIFRTTPATIGSQRGPVATAS